MLLSDVLRDLLSDVLVLLTSSAKISFRSMTVITKGEIARFYSNSTDTCPQVGSGFGADSLSAFLCRVASRPVSIWCVILNAEKTS